MFNKLYLQALGTVGLTLNSIRTSGHVIGFRLRRRSCFGLSKKIVEEFSDLLLRIIRLFLNNSELRVASVGNLGFVGQ